MDISHIISHTREAPFREACKILSSQKLSKYVPILSLTLKSNWITNQKDNIWIRQRLD